MATTTAVADFKFTINFDGTITDLRWAPFKKTSGLGTVTGDLLTTSSNGAVNTVLGNAGDLYVDLKGSIFVGATGGVLGFGWSQNTSDAGNTTVYKNSYGIVMKVS